MDRLVDFISSIRYSESLISSSWSAFFAFNTSPPSCRAILTEAISGYYVSSANLEMMTKSSSTNLRNYSELSSIF